jgi:hypothetical protein
MSRRTPVVLFRDDFGYDSFQFVALGLIAIQAQELTQRQEAASTVSTTKPTPTQFHGTDAGAQTPADPPIQFIAGLLTARSASPAIGSVDQSLAKMSINQLQDYAQEAGQSFSIKQLFGLNHEFIQ